MKCHLICSWHELSRDVSFETFRAPQMWKVAFMYVFAFFQYNACICILSVQNVYLRWSYWHRVQNSILLLLFCQRCIGKKLIVLDTVILFKKSTTKKNLIHKSKFQALEKQQVFTTKSSSAGTKSIQLSWEFRNKWKYVNKVKVLSTFVSCAWKGQTIGFIKSSL